jgi:hypothetical protein
MGLGRQLHTSTTSSRHQTTTAMATNGQRILSPAKADFRNKQSPLSSITLCAISRQCCLDDFKIRWRISPRMQTNPPDPQRSDSVKRDTVAGDRVSYYLQLPQFQAIPKIQILSCDGKLGSQWIYYRCRRNALVQMSSATFRNADLGSKRPALNCGRTRVYQYGVVHTIRLEVDLFRGADRLLA